MEKQEDRVTLEAELVKLHQDWEVSQREYSNAAFPGFALATLGAVAGGFFLGFFGGIFFFLVGLSLVGIPTTLKRGRRVAEIDLRKNEVNHKLKLIMDRNPHP